MAVLLDAFTNNSFDTALWTRVETTGTVVEQNNRLEFIYSTGYPGTAYVDSVSTVNVTGDEVYLKLEVVPNSATYFRLALVDASGDGWAWRINRVSNTMQAQTISGNVYSDVTVYTDFAVATHVWLRLREAGGTIFWDFSTDGTSFTNRQSTAKPGNVDLTAMTIRFGQFQSDATGTFAVSNLYGPAFAGGGSARFRPYFITG